MWDFFYKYSESVLAGFAVVFLAVMAVCFFWGIDVLVSDVGHALNSGGIVNQQPGFDLKGASELDLKGLMK